MKVFWLFSLFTITALGSQQALARRDVKAHVHGEAELTLVLDGKNLQLEAKIPMNDLVGFEHKPKSQKQKDAWETASSNLKDANKQLSLPSAASCNLEKASLEDIDHHGHHGHHDKKKEKHKHHSKHDKKDGHHHEHGHGDHHNKKDDHHHGHGDDDHADVRVKYLFQCQKPAAINKIQVNLFKDFKSLKKVRASFVGPKGQGHKLLTASDNTIELSK